MSVRDAYAGELARERWLDRARGFAIVALLLQHAANIPAFYVGVAAPDWANAINNFLHPVRMPVLMVIAGYLVARASSRPTAAYYLKQLQRLGWPYLVWAAILLAGTDLLLGTSLMTNLSSWIPAGYLWFLLYALCYSLVAGVLPSRAAPWVAGAAIAATLLMPNAGAWRDFFYFAVFYFVGVILGQHRETVRRLLDSRVTLVAGLCALMVHGALTVLPSGTLFDIVVSPRGTLWIPVVLVSIAGVLSFARLSPDGAWWRPWESAGRHSLELYLSHWMAMAVTAFIASKVGVASSSAMTGLLLLLSIAVGALLVRFRRHWFVASLFRWPFSRRMRAVP